MHVRIRKQPPVSQTESSLHSVLPDQQKGCDYFIYLCIYFCIDLVPKQKVVFKSLIGITLAIGYPSL